MGNADFWIETVMKKVRIQSTFLLIVEDRPSPNQECSLSSSQTIPEFVADAEKGNTNLDYYATPANLDHSNVFHCRPQTPWSWEDDLAHFEFGKCRCSKALEDYLDTHPSMRYSFTFDVVYSLSTFQAALGGVEECVVYSRLGISEDDRGQFRPYIVFNARNQEFEIRHGITNTNLLTLLRENANDILHSALKNCYSMLDDNGNIPTESVLRNRYIDQFTPEFYPMRYILKDDLYSQYLDVLDVLLHHVLENYRQAGVRYIEFSVGHGDLITRPYVFRRLYESVDTFRRNISLTDRDPFTVRFLAAFGRHKSPSLKELVQSLKEQGKIVDLSSLPDPLAEDTYPLSYLTDLEKVAEVMNHDKAKEFIVGLDYVGDEKDHPYCPFGLTKFTDFVKKCRNVNPNFGLRFHCGEISFNVGDHYLHMAVSSKVITAILKNLDGPTPLRIGHGVAFFAQELQRLHSNPNPYAVDSTTVALRQCLNEMILKAVPVEINLRSNHVLLMGRDNTDAVKVLHGKYQLPIVLCTDDDGIFDVTAEYGGETFHSVAAEYAKALKASNITTKGNFDLVVNYGLQAKFSA